MELDIFSQLSYNGLKVVLGRRTAAEIVELLSDASFRLRTETGCRDIANDLERVAKKLEKSLGHSK